MKYYNWPDTPVGKTPTYTTATLKLEIPEEDLSTHTYKWDDMIKLYKEGSYTEEQGQAVAQLCYDLGVASKMDYDSRNRAGSSTSVVAAANAARTYFKYNKDMRIAISHHYTEAEWAAILKNEIKQGRPLPYGASKEAEGTGYLIGGHCFVVDGYNTDGLFHINWGWGGRSNGYFLITSLDPLEEGIGGTNSAGGFSVNQQTLLDFIPDRTGTSTAQEHYVFQYNNCMRANGDSISIMALFNQSLDAFHGDIVMQLIDKDGVVAAQETVKKDYSCDIEVFEKHVNVSLDPFDFSKFADGIYHTDLILVSKATGKEYPVKHLNPDSRIIVENGKLKGIFNCALLEGKLLGYENVVFTDRILKLKLKGQVKNVDNIDFLAKDGLKLAMSCYSTVNNYNELYFYSIEKNIKPGETITFEGDLEVGVVSGNDDEIMIELGILDANGKVVTIDYPLNDILVATHINDVNINKVEGKSPAFSLDGKRVDASNAKGVIIKDGKKTIKSH